MKRILLLITIICLIFVSGFCLASINDTKMPTINLGGVKYKLQYSEKSSQTGGYVNEYFKPNESYTSWTELVAVHHYPRAFYPIEHAKVFNDFLNLLGNPAYIEINDKDNSALLSFVVTDKKKLPIILEYNVFKYEKSPVCGTVALQYAKRYRLNNPLEVEELQKSFAKNTVKYIRRAEKVKIPEVITRKIDKGQYVEERDITENSEQKIDKNISKDVESISKPNDAVKNIQKEENNSDSEKSEDRKENNLEEISTEENIEP